MSEPEIARRCQNCGASVRGRAHFCPQCGRPMGAEQQPPAAAARAREAAQPHALAEEAERVAAALQEKLSGSRAMDSPAAQARTSAGEEADAAAHRADEGAREIRGMADEGAGFDPLTADEPARVYGQPAGASVNARATDEGANDDAARAAAADEDILGLDEDARADERTADDAAPVAARAADEGDGRGAGVLQRAAVVGARAGETLRPGVEKLREAVVAFDEVASDDPGRRFLFAAAALFAVFLLLWAFSYALG